ncbi:hypothetical protein BRADI_1g13600v3 [Brachypodium distachyon]|uniref:Uncharacterized protein n=1 Tax=Brachypodium distachyon TaxID=15368 RepID=A0A2K2DJC5_BRADI|nr:hypothetical protein BRADI_1g13600v3 [Brachypodium distachyon]
MFSGDWTPPCGSCCTKKYANLVQIPCIGKCTEICYKDPVLEDRQWSAYIDRSPGEDSYSLECFNACISGCGYRGLDCVPKHGHPRLCTFGVFQ